MVASFHSLDLIDGKSTKLADELRNPAEDRMKIGVEFVRKYNRAAIAWVVLTPPLGSLIFAIIWMSIYLRDPGDTQATITAAFTVSTYLVTAGT
jgi:hypothetical protein